MGACCQAAERSEATEGLPQWEANEIPPQNDDNGTAQQTSDGASAAETPTANHGAPNSGENATKEMPQKEVPQPAQEAPKKENPQPPQDAQEENPPPPQDAQEEDPQLPQWTQAVPKPSDPSEKPAHPPKAPQKNARGPRRNTPEDKETFENLLRKRAANLNGGQPLNGNEGKLLLELKLEFWTEEHKRQFNFLKKSRKFGKEWNELSARDPYQGLLKGNQNRKGDAEPLTRGDRVRYEGQEGPLPGDDEPKTRKDIQWGHVGDIVFIDEEGDYLIKFFECRGPGNPKKIKEYFQWVRREKMKDENWEKVYLPGQEEWNALGGRALEPLFDVTTVIDVRWLCKFAKGEVMKEKKGVVPAWQQVPKEGKAKLEQLQHFSSGALSNLGLSVAVLSYGWAAKRHPDPTGEQLKLLQGVLEMIVEDCERSTNQVRKMWGGELSKTTCSFGMVWDFMSFPQRGYTKRYDPNVDDRTPQQISIFKRGLNGINEWYGHEHTFVLVLNTPMPAGSENDAPYLRRGWCIFERRISSMTKGQNCFMEVGKNEIEDSGAKTFASLADFCHTRSRPAPMAPESFTKMLLDGVEQERTNPGTGIKFTSGKDLTEIVIPQYEKGFRRIMATGFRLAYTDVQWGDEDATNLAHSLSWANKAGCLGDLYDLRVSGNKITDIGGMAMAAAMAEGALDGITEFAFLEKGVGDKTIGLFAKSISAGKFCSGPLAQTMRGMGFEPELSMYQPKESKVWAELQQACNARQIKLKGLA